MYEEKNIDAILTHYYYLMVNNTINKIVLCIKKYNKNSNLNIIINKNIFKLFGCQF